MDANGQSDVVVGPIGALLVSGEFFVHRTAKMKDPWSFVQIINCGTAPNPFTS
jgi:hypothetical protein